jgi:acyl-CoA thioesterase
VAPTRFERDTALTPTADGIYEGRIDEGWRIVRGANGGHLAAILLRGVTLAAATTDHSPRALTVHFNRVPKDDAVHVTVETERMGRTMSTYTARMRQNDKLVAIGLASFSAPRRGPDFADISIPEVPAPESSEVVADREDFPFGQHFDFRRALGPAPGERSDRAEHAVWMRLREAQPVDHVVVTQLCDAWAPAVFVKLGEGGGGAGVPTVEMTYHYREVLPLADANDDDWYLGVFRTTVARGGFIEEDGWLWSRMGTLLAQSRQLAILQNQ